MRGVLFERQVEFFQAFWIGGSLSPKEGGPYGKGSNNVIPTNGKARLSLWRTQKEPPNRNLFGKERK